MTLRELMDQFKDAPMDSEVKFGYETYPQCSCAEYCYCSPEERILKVSVVLFEKRGGKTAVSKVMLEQV
jgi:hypothetical protein